MLPEYSGGRLMYTSASISISESIASSPVPGSPTTMWDSSGHSRWLVASITAVTPPAGVMWNRTETGSEMLGR